MHRWLLVACALEVRAAAAQPITNGLPAADPAVVALVAPSGEVGCTASIIGPHTAITAAHCVAGGDARTLRVFFGEAIDGAGDRIAVSHARVHPGFDPGGRDLAMLTLREPAPVAPLVLEPATLDASLVGTTFRIVGFGITGQGLSDAGVKRAGTARIAAVREEELIAVPEPSLTCLGDSGGPALLAAGTIAGVVSRGDSACRDHSVYTRVDVARSILIQPYLAETAPGTATVGDACFYEGHCADGPCLGANDDPLLYFCSRACRVDADCPSSMRCATDGCRYPEPSPGALGSPCQDSGDCTSQLCREDVCTRSCDGEAPCPVGFACEAGFCVVAPAGGCGCASNTGAPGLAILVALLFARRRGGMQRA